MPLQALVKYVGVDKVKTIERGRTDVDIRSPEDVTQRLDRIIKEIRENWHAPVIGKPKSAQLPPADVLIVAHGHILRAFAMRWVDKKFEEGPAFLLEAGGVGTLR